MQGLIQMKKKDINNAGFSLWLSFVLIMILNGTVISVRNNFEALGYIVAASIPIFIGLSIITFKEES